MLPPDSCRTSRASTRHIVSCRGLCASSFALKSHMRPVPLFLGVSKQNSSKSLAKFPAKNQKKITDELLQERREKSFVRQAQSTRTAKLDPTRVSTRVPTRVPASMHGSALRGLPTKGPTKRPTRMSTERAHESCQFSHVLFQTPPSYGFGCYGFGFFGPRIAFRATGAL